MRSMRSRWGRSMGPRGSMRSSRCIPGSMGGLGSLRSRCMRSMSSTRSLGSMPCIFSCIMRCIFCMRSICGIGFPSGMSFIFSMFFIFSMRSLHMGHSLHILHSIS